MTKYQYRKGRKTVNQDPIVIEDDSENNNMNTIEDNFEKSSQNMQK